MSTAKGTFAKLTELYQRMEQAYSVCARTAGLSCSGCEDNCCTSYFQHHTYVEWIYLWKGLNALSSAKRTLYVRQAHIYMEHCTQALAINALPTAMCPLNENGRCGLYSHRLMICRLHGTRNKMTLPHGGERIFPGCSRFVGLHEARQRGQLPAPAGDAHPCVISPASSTAVSTAPLLLDSITLDRTPFYKELAALELELYQRLGVRLPKVDMTLAQMLVAGPPSLS